MAGEETFETDRLRRDLRAQGSRMDEISRRLYAVEDVLDKPIEAPDMGYWIDKLEDELALIGRNDVLYMDRNHRFSVDVPFWHHVESYCKKIIRLKEGEQK